MNSIRKAAAVLLALAMVLSSVSLCFAAKYSDLEDHWAKSYMEDLVERGMLTGYTDGTMKPDGTITYAEALVFLSRLYTPESDEADAMFEEFSSVIKKATSEEWTWKPLSICLAAGIITQTELKSITFSKPIPKQTLSLFMVRAMQKSDKATDMASSELSFKDAASISKSCLGSIAFLTSIKVTQGDDLGNFNPAQSVTRAVCSTMISRVIDYNEDNEIELKIKGYGGSEKLSGIILSADEDSFVLRDAYGVCRSFNIASSTVCKLNSKSTALTEDNAGQYAEVSANEGTAVKITIETEDDESWVQGYIKSVGDGTISYKDADSGKVCYFDGTETEFTLNGKTSSFGKMSAGYYFTACVKEGSGKNSDAAKTLDAYTEETAVTGEIKSVEYAATVTLKLKLEEKSDIVCYMDISSLPAIYSGKLKVSVDKLKAADKVEVIYNNGVITKITAEAENISLSGKLSAITTSVTGTSWTIEKSDGNQVTYALDKGTKAYNGEDAVDPSSVAIGDTVSIIVAEGVIAEASIENAVSTSVKISGEILATDKTTRIITILTAEKKLVYINCKTIGGIISTETGQSLSFSKLKAGQQIIIYGSYSSNTEFDAKSIIVE